MATRLNANTIDAIENDADFFAFVAKLLRVKPSSLPTILRRNGKQFTQIDTLMSIASYMKKPVDDIIEKIAEKAPAEA